MQSKDQWCWSGVSKSILNYYGTNVTQEEIAEYATDGDNIWNWLYGYTSSPKRMGIDYILDYFGNFPRSHTNGLDRYLTSNEIRLDINNDKISVVRWLWPDDSGHFVVLHGYNGVDDSMDCYIMDPWPGEGFGIYDYEWLKNGAGGAGGNLTHEWTHTLTLGSYDFFNRIPIVENPGDQTLVIGDNLVLLFDGTDLDGDILNYEFQGLNDLKTSRVDENDLTSSWEVLWDSDVIGNFTLEVSCHDGTLSSNINIEVEVEKKSQNIKFDPLDDRTIGVSSFFIHASASSGLTPSFISADSNIVTVTGNLVTVKNIGETSITASQSGNDTYKEAISVSQFIRIVDKALPKINWNPNLKIFYGYPIDEEQLNATADMQGSYNYNVTHGEIFPPGNVMLSLEFIPDEFENFKEITLQKVLEIEKLDQEIYFNEITPKTYGDGLFFLDAVSESGGPLTFISTNTNVITISDNIAKIESTGYVDILVNQSGNQFFKSAQGNQLISVSKSHQNIFIDIPTSKKVGALPFYLNGYASSGLNVSYESLNSEIVTIQDNLVYINGSGSANIIAYQNGNHHFYPSDNIEFTLAVSEKAFPDLNWETPEPIIYGTPISIHQLNATSTTTGDFIYSAEINEILNVGNNVITAYFTPFDTGTYSANSISIIQVVNKLSQAITFSKLIETEFASKYVSLAAQSTSGRPINFHSSDPFILSIHGSMGNINGTGNVVVTATQSGNQIYYDAMPRSQSLSILKSNQKIAFSPPGSKYLNDNNFILNASVDSNLDLVYFSSNTNVATVENGIVKIKGVGITDITVSQPGDSNYKPAQSISYPLLITDKYIPEIIWEDNFLLTYGEALPESFFKASCNIKGGMEYNYQPSERLNSGTHIFTVSFIPDDEVNYARTTQSVELKISKAKLDVDFGLANYFYVYGDNVIFPEINYSGFKYNEDKNDLDSPVHLKLVDLSGLAYNVGDYQVQSFGGSDQNYFFSHGNTTLTIQPAILTVKADDITRLELQENPELTYSISGFKNRDTVNSLDQRPIIKTFADINSPIGEYEIFVEGGKSSNYNFEYDFGTLKIVSEDEDEDKISIFSLEVSTNIAKTGELITILGVGLSSVGSNLVWRIYSDNILINQESNAVLNSEIKFTSAGEKIIEVKLSDGENEISKMLSVTIIKSQPPSGNIDLSELSLSVSDIVKDLNNGLDETEGSEILDQLLTEQDGFEMAKGFLAFAATVSEGAKKSFNSINSDVDLFVEHIVDEKELVYMGNKTQISVTGVSPNTTIIVSTGISADYFDNLPEGSDQDSIFTIDAKNDNGVELTELGEIWTLKLLGKANEIESPKIYYQDEFQEFIDSGFEVSVDGSDLLIKANHLTTFILVDEGEESTSQTTTTGSGGGGGCLVNFNK